MTSSSLTEELVPIRMFPMLGGADVSYPLPSPIGDADIEETLMNDMTPAQTGSAAALPLSSSATDTPFRWLRSEIDRLFETFAGPAQPSASVSSRRRVDRRGKGTR